jgi:hypothetical protein
MAIGCEPKSRLVPLALLCAASFAQPVLAQPAPTPETVISRAREDLDPLGARVGAFQIFPELALEYRKDSNVFATRRFAIDDTALVLKPGITMRSDWTRNSLVAGFNAALTNYDNLSTEDHNDSDAFLQGRWDTANGGFFSGDLDRSVDHEGRESADDARGLERARFATDDLTLGYRVTPGKALFQYEVDIRKIDYDDVPGPNGPINNDDRDREAFGQRLRIGYEVFDGYSLFFQAIDESTDYASRLDDNGFERSSDGRELVVGAALNLTDVIFGNVFYGRKSHRFDDARFAKIGGSAFGLDLSWNITPLTTISFEGRQEVVPTTILGASGVDERSLGIRADHELLRNLILSLDWRTETGDFKGVPRQDKNEVASFGARYLMNRRFEIEFDYTRRNRRSDIEPDLTFSKNIVSLQFKGQL